MKRISGSALAAALLVPGAAGAAEPVRLAPASDWLLDYGTERCSLVRDFEQGGQSVQLRIESFGSWRDFRITLVGRLVARSGRSADEIRYRFSPDQEDRQTVAILGSSGGQPALSFTTAFGAPEAEPGRLSREEQLARAATPKPVEPEFERAISSLRVDPHNRTAFELALGRMGAPLEAVRQCVDDLQKSWGLDPAAQRDRSRLPVIEIATLRDVQRSYPATRASGGTAFVPVRVMIDGDGQATACIIQTVGVPKAFTDAVCEGLMGRYQPALDKSGSPIPTAYNTSVIYLGG